MKTAPLKCGNSIPRAGGGREVAVIRFDETGFFIEGEAAGELQALRKEFKSSVKNGDFDFTAFLFSQAE